MPDSNDKKESERKSRTDELLAYLERRLKELEEEEKKFRKYALNEDKN